MQLQRTECRLHGAAKNLQRKLQFLINGLIFYNEIFYDHFVMYTVLSSLAACGCLGGGGGGRRVCLSRVAARGQLARDQ